VAHSRADRHRPLDSKSCSRWKGAGEDPCEATDRPWTHPGSTEVELEEVAKEEEAQHWSGEKMTAWMVGSGQRAEVVEGDSSEKEQGSEQNPEHAQPSMGANMQDSRGHSCSYVDPCPCHKDDLVAGKLEHHGGQALDIRYV
jgi:hypothetical protein